jgi:HPt (histidine-containing phosphotransfer) domain-containing protein
MPREGSPAPPGCVFDRADLLRRLGGDLELAKEVVQLFLADAPAQVTKLREAVLRGAVDEIAYAGHRVGGAAANLGGTRLRRAVEAVEQAPLEGVGARGRRAELMAEVDREYALLEQAMREEWFPEPRPGAGL